MGTISRITTFSAGSVLTAAQLNNEFDNILATANGNLNAANLGVTAGIAAASKALVLDASRDLDDSTGGNQIRNLALAGTLSVTGNADFDGVTNLDAVDIDGAVQLDSTLTVGANDQGYDVILYGDTASANLTWDTSVDDLIWNGAARAVIPDSQLVLGSTAVTTTGAEINLIDGGTSRGTTAVASGDGILINDAGTMRMTNVDTVSTYFSSHNVGGTNIVTVGTIGTGTWQGTAIASAYLDSDTAHLSGTQTFSGAKTFSAAATLATGSTVGNLTLANGSITDSSGSISMGDENLSTTGTLAAGATTIGGTLDFNSGTIDLSTQTVDVTLNAAVDALNFDSNTLSIDASNNRVGIGEAAPGALLHLKKNNGSAAIRMEREDTSVASGNEIGGLIITGGESSADTPVARIVTYADDTWTSSSSPTRIEFEVTPSGATADVLAMTLDSTGYLGIGTAAPEGLVHAASGDASIAPSGNANQIVAEAGGNSGISILSGATSNGVIYFGDSGSNAYGQVDYDHNNDSMTFAVAGAGRATLTATGLGIGTAAPAQLLHLKGTAQPNFKLETTGDNHPHLMISGNRSGQNVETGRLQFQWNGNAIATIAGVSGPDNTNKDDGVLSFQTAAAGGAMTERMRINQLGQIGINCEPLDMFHLRIADNINMQFGYPSGATASIGALTNGEGAYIDMRIDADELHLNSQSGGKLGIGTAAPLEKLTVSGSHRGTSQNWQAQMVNTDSMAVDKGGGVAFGGSYTGTTGTYFASINGAKENSTDSNVAGYLALSTRAAAAAQVTERLRINSNGMIDATSDNKVGYYGKRHTFDALTMADDATVTLSSGGAGAALLIVYEHGSGVNALYYVGYGVTPVLMQNNGSTWASADTDGNYCVITSGHTTTFKNRIGAEKIFSITLFSAGLS